MLCLNGDVSKFYFLIYLSKKSICYNGVKVNHLFILRTESGIYVLNGYWYYKFILDFWIESVSKLCVHSKYFYLRFFAVLLLFVFRNSFKEKIILLLVFFIVKFMKNFIFSSFSWFLLFVLWFNDRNLIKYCFTWSFLFLLHKFFVSRETYPLKGPIR